MLQMQSKSLSNELLDYFMHSLSAPSKSAFTQQRYKLLPEGWKFLFDSFVMRCRSLSDNLYHGYRLLACDGSDVNISRNPSDEKTFIHEGEKGYNAIHVNALYDITNSTYCDFIVQGKKKLHERAALNQMVDRYKDQTPSILMADRGYESFNTFAYLIHKDMKFVIRMKDINSNGILSAYELPDDEFDTFIATNLDADTFPLAELKKLYRLRWSEETNFRELKYTIGLINWHSSKYEGILQELCARMILYNFCELVTAHAIVQTNKKTKHFYKINFATAVNICRAYLKHGGDENECMLLIQKHLTPVRHDRKYPINLRPRRNRDFIYRVA